ncbi:secY/secA suppressor protein [Serratia quinivorans]|uniref:MysB family protein n=1 Tax=Serratia quinivorans TaxID=137545 RepID=A0ABV3UEQ0_9GAMM|nr:MysB family protein [Serratia quinivorans]MBV6691298.1 secY/secA suppressor protein [Serratia quinivorans]CAI0768603.1 secY/secA suppressor protein [Serratia quinivorans]CAI1508430.1 secY/secA suppressor protein [Serratia quinivorans]CAI1689721.1 secY/secA suppressor protein [Serratia quinivorans]CAI1832338.1 secY/secA suppressor protein [Serratia quinivorans]
MSLYATLEDAIEAAREEFIESAESGSDDQPPAVQQFNLQKYVMLDGDIMWQAEFFEQEGESVECLTLRSGEAAQAIFDGDYDEIEISAEWIEENTLHEWEEGDFQLDPPLDTEEGQTAADEWDER